MSQKDLDAASLQRLKENIASGRFDANISKLTIEDLRKFSPAQPADPLDHVPPQFRLTPAEYRQAKAMTRLTYVEERVIAAKYEARAVADLGVRIEFYRNDALWICSNSGIEEGDRDPETAYAKYIAKVR